MQVLRDGIFRDANVSEALNDGWASQLIHCSQTHGSKTIEGDFFDALVKAGVVSADNADDHRKVDINRAARTDAGVHAAGNVSVAASAGPFIS